jgi:hypothetical protein
MKDVLACLYSSQPSLMAATQAFAAKRREIGSISDPQEFLYELSSNTRPEQNYDNYGIQKIFNLRHALIAI